MRAKAGDPPRTMVQKILSSARSADQVALVCAPHAALVCGIAQGLKKTSAEVAIAYETACVTMAGEAHAADGREELMARGILVARAGAGFPAPLHLERFGSPGRLCLTDDRRLAALGGIGMLTLHAPASELGAALCGRPFVVTPPHSVHVQLAGRTRAFVCARDVALELVRRGLEAVVKGASADGVPVVIEFGGPSVRLMSVAERAVLASIAPRVGAAAAIFPSDERTEVFLRDQRRSKAHRALSPDAGAPFDGVMQIDLGAVDPLLLDASGKVCAVRELAGRPVGQVVLGGDTGATLRDLLAVAMLLKSKRVPTGVELLLTPPTRQTLEVLAAEGALSDLIATGARIIEPDARILSGELYPPPTGTLSLHASEVVPASPRTLTASPETLAYAVATGAIGDPRGFKRPVRVSVPRTLPTDDVLVARSSAIRPKR